MPIAFPPLKRGNPFDRWAWQVGYRAIPQAQVAPNMASPGAAFNSKGLDPGIAAIRATNLRDLGKMYRHGGGPPPANPVNVPANDRRAFNRVLSDARGVLSGVSYDSAGAALSGCRVMVFRTSDNGFVTETTSDGAGAWSITLGLCGALFLVEYKAGAPDVAGTSVNTLSPAAF